MIARLAAALFLLSLVSFTARAQDASVPPVGGAAPSAPFGATHAAPKTNTSSFEMLPPGDRKIARALFLAQRPTARGPAPLSLNQIADLKGRGGWSRVFKQMQAEGLIQAKNLGQVVSGYERQLHSRAAIPTRRQAAVLVTNAQGGVTGSSRGQGVAHGGDEISSDRNAAVAVATTDDEAPPRPGRSR